MTKSKSDAIIPDSESGHAASAIPAGSLVVAAVIVAVGVIGILAMDMAGSRMFLSLVEAGLAWCF